MAGPIEIPNFELIREIGRGGMASVWLARQLQPKRDVAIKIVAPGGGNDESFMQSLKQEGDTVAQFNHSNIVTVYACGVVDQHYFLAMEILSGGDLTERIQAGLTPEEALDITRQMASALAHAHKRHVLHRDIKPENILFDEEGRAVLVDFGIAKETDKDSEFTRMGCVVGTPHYMSPERAQGHPVDGRSDLYAVGVVLYEMLTGKKLYEKEDTFAISYAHVYEPIPPLPPELAEYQPLLNKLLAKDPDDRFQTADELLEALEAPGKIPTASTRPVQGQDPNATRAMPAGGQATRAMQGAETQMVEEQAATSPPAALKKHALPAAIVLLAVAVGGWLWMQGNTIQQKPVSLLTPQELVRMNDLLAAARTQSKLGNVEMAISNYEKVLTRFDCRNTEALSALQTLAPDKYDKIVKNCAPVGN